MEKRNGVWLAAVSGGPDSMALADMCLRSGTAFAVAHVNYHHRPEADEEEAWVRQWCLEHGIVCHVRNEAFVYTGNFEAAARTWRYDFFEQLVRQFGYAGILTGHHQDDLIETYIMQKEKNIIPEYWGLKDSIMYHGILLERPLLHMTKKELEDYCSENGIRWYLDATNLQDDYARNKVRHEVIDHLSQMERTMILREIRMENAVMTERRCRVRTEIRDGETELSAYRRYQTDDRLALLRMIAEPQKQGPGLSRKFLEEADHILMNHNDFVIDVRDQQLVQKNGRFFL
ncbi:MAG TPA: tRNA lysidine(34) synthetase TilS, partial [Erysipelotrichaceae bacterium]|nr:tRNA lysidine(34) synthetase TilS [Erysipelotrichaceae bacterium]